MIGTGWPGDHAVGEGVIAYTGAAGRNTGLDLVFGEVLPDSTSDDRPWLADSESDERDQWLQENRPPHHDIA